MSLRAAIRAKVTAARLRTCEADRTRRHRKAAAKAYFDLACDLIAPPAPTLIAVGGLSGTGKSVLARALAPDVLPCRARCCCAPMSSARRCSAWPKPRSYRRELTARMAPRADLRAAQRQARRILAAGHSVDRRCGVFARRRTHRDRSGRARPATSLPRAVSDRRSCERASHASARGRNDASDADAEIARKQEDYDLGALAWTTVDASGTPADTLRHARTALRG